MPHKTWRIIQLSSLVTLVSKSYQYIDRYIHQKLSATTNGRRQRKHLREIGLYLSVPRLLWWGTVSHNGSQWQNMFLSQSTPWKNKYMFFNCFPQSVRILSDSWNSCLQFWPQASSPCWIAKYGKTSSLTGPLQPCHPKDWGSLL